MKCDFDSTLTFDRLRKALVPVGVLSFSTGFAFFSISNSISEYSFAVLFLIVVLYVILSILRKGCIVADENQLEIYHTFFSRKLFVSYVAYEDIIYTDYRLEKRCSKSGFICYVFILVIRLKNRRTIIVSKDLDMSENFSVYMPDEYRKYMDNLPLTVLHGMLSEKVKENLNVFYI